jgi:hypothetical protein
VNKKPASLTPEAKRIRDIRNGVLLAHVVVSWVVVAAVRFRWWTVFAHGDTVGEFFGSDEKAFQTGYITLAAIIAFFFTSYDIVTNSDIQWPPLLASAFALGCAAEVTWKFNSQQDTVMKHLIAEQLSRDMKKEEDRANAVALLDSSSVAGVSSGSPAPVASASRAEPDVGIRVRLGPGLLTTLFGTFSMVVLSSYLTFFARRDGT